MTLSIELVSAACGALNTETPCTIQFHVVIMSTAKIVENKIPNQKLKSNIFIMDKMRNDFLSQNLWL